MRKLIAICLLLFVGGCMTAKKQQRIAESFYADFPDSLAKACMQKFPPKVGEVKPGVVKVDTVVKTDTAAVNRWAKRFDSLLANLPVKVIHANADSMRKAIRSILVNQFSEECKSMAVEKWRVDTLPVADSAAIKYWYGSYMHERDERNKVEGKLQAMETEKDAWKSKARNRWWIIAGLIVAIGAGIFLRIKGIL